MAISRVHSVVSLASPLDRKMQSHALHFRSPPRAAVAPTLDFATRGQVLQLAAQLAARIARGEVLYLHCWGGHGRTGTVVSIMLHLMYGLDAEEAMRRCQHVHDIRRIPISVGSPQTEAQRAQVRRVISKLQRRSGRGDEVATVAAPAQAFRKQACVDISAQVHNGRRLAGTGPLPSPEKKAAEDAASVASSGGRRGWVRRHRQAFAQAPNGVGEEVTGWLSLEEDDDAEHKSEDQPHAANAETAEVDYSSRTVVADALVGVTTRQRSPSIRETEVVGLQRARRRSFTTPFSEGEASRAGRLSRLRRKSSPSLNSPHMMERSEQSCVGTSATDDPVSRTRSSPVTGKRDSSDISAGESEGSSLAPPCKVGNGIAGPHASRSSSLCSVGSRHVAGCHVDEARRT